MFSVDCSFSAQKYSVIINCGNEGWLRGTALQLLKMEVADSTSGISKWQNFN